MHTILSFPAPITSSSSTSIDNVYFFNRLPHFLELWNIVLSLTMRVCVCVCGILFLYYFLLPYFFIIFRILSNIYLS